MSHDIHTLYFSSMFYDLMVSQWQTTGTHTQREISLEYCVHMTSKRL
uniref:Uncharacterized protein n=1 Tax=Setaria italica TaxID=4555 RepID=K4A3H3_SETIT